MMVGDNDKLRWPVPKAAESKQSSVSRAVRAWPWCTICWHCLFIPGAVLEQCPPPTASIYRRCPKGGLKTKAVMEMSPHSGGFRAVRALQRGRRADVRCVLQCFAEI